MLFEKTRPWYVMTPVDTNTLADFDSMCVESFRSGVKFAETFSIVNLTFGKKSAPAETAIFPKGCHLPCWKRSSISPLSIPSSESPGAKARPRGFRHIFLQESRRAAGVAIAVSTRHEGERASTAEPCRGPQVSETCRV